MRGKKSFDDNEDHFNLLKRAGFLGMRGKKNNIATFLRNHQFESWPYYLIPYASKSRRANSGFVGMRG